MGEFDKLKEDAEQYAREHPEQVRKGEEAVEARLGADASSRPEAAGDEQGGHDGSGDDGAGQAGEDR